MAHNKEADMSYGSYRAIKLLLESEKQRIQDNWRTAAVYFDDAGKKAHEKAYARVSAQIAEIAAAEDQLTALVREHYATHPNKKIREFWGRK